MTPINQTNLSYFTYTNEEIVRLPIRGIVLDFHGLGGTGMISAHSDFAMRCAERGVLLLAPYYGPWSWMNDIAVRIVDEILDAVFDRHALADSIPAVSTGGSMGGLSALIYARYARHAPTACAANCPVCDLPYHYTERVDLPRTIYFALAHYDMDFEQAKKSISPLHQAEKMPDIPYYIAHCDADMAVNKEKHSDAFVGAMRNANRRVEYDIVPNRGHCDLTPEARERYERFIFEVIG